MNMLLVGFNVADACIMYAACQCTDYLTSEAGKHEGRSGSSVIQLSNASYLK